MCLLLLLYLLYVTSFSCISLKTAAGPFRPNKTCPTYRLILGVHTAELGACPPPVVPKFDTVQDMRRSVDVHCITSLTAKQPEFKRLRGVVQVYRRMEQSLSQSSAVFLPNLILLEEASADEV